MMIQFSHPLSAMLRPVFEVKKLKAVVGMNLAAAMVIVEVTGTPIEAVNQLPDVEVATVVVDSVVVSTEGRFGLPLETIDVSQGFSRLHRGVDLRASLKTPVRAIEGGRVAQVVQSRWGYGWWINIDHDGGVTSLYAHLGQVTVSEGESIQKGQVVGEVGLTGWTTGPHLHLEIYERGQALNPLQALPKVKA